MTTLEKQLAHQTLATPRLRDSFVALIFSCAALLVFCVFLINTIPPKITEKLYLLFGFGAPLDVMSQHLASFIFFLIAVLSSRMFRANILPLKFARGTARQLLVCCTGVTALFLLFHTTLYALEVPPSSWERDYVFGHNQGYLVLFNTALLVPANEELVFRGIIPFTVMNLILLIASPFTHAQNPSFRSVALILGMVLSSLLFAVMHHRGPVYDAYFFALGLWFGYWACKTNGLMIPIISHAFAGLLAVGTIYIQNI